ncbi:VWA domain-containing protein [Tunturiibacter gelidoferens]|uniref:VWFA-related protein n=1 Tax=Tunturiibacter gelidiferens TaxID=3069689 RepID=A0A9X0QJW7_9BACT|nr:VWA domain-containing protein [Edaphobacter lichenicola]MBB5331605.1 VWFA-related protein [Edaphobacter lichenicola]
MIYRVCTTKPEGPIKLPLLHALFLFALAAGLSHSVPAQQPSPAPAATQDPRTQTQPPTNPPPAASQPTKDANGVYTIRRNARLVILDMVVTDAKGNIVTDLKRDDFHVTEANEPEKILNFDAPAAHTLNPELTINSTEELDRLAPNAPVNIILLDEFNTRFEDMAFARYSLKKFLNRQPGKLDTPTMLLAVDLQHFTVVHDYTQNKDDIIAALDHHFAAYPWQAQQGQWRADRINLAFLTLRRVAEAVIGHPGHKNMIWIGRGFPSVRWEGVPVDTVNLVNNAVQDCVNILRDARVTLYTIDPAGVQIEPQAYGRIAGRDDPFGGEYQFNILAKATGGRTLYGRNDVDAEIGTSIRDGASFYSLTYRPENTSLDPSKFRNIKITIDRPGLTVYTRQGYYLQRGPGRVDPVNPSRRLMTDIISADTSTMVYDGVPVTLEPSPTDPNRFIIHVASSGTYWSPATDTEPRHSDLVLAVTTFDRKGKVLKSVAKLIHASAPTTVPPTGRIERGVDLAYNVDPDPKAVRVRFVVRVSFTGRIGTVDANLGQQHAGNPASSVPANP